MAQSKFFYLLDTNAAVHYYFQHPLITPQIDWIIEQRGLEGAFIFIPQFCIAEVFNTFAKIHYRPKEIYPLEYHYVSSLLTEDYKKIRDNFIADIKFGRIFYNYELNRYHTFNADHVMKFEHQIELTRWNQETQKREPWFLSTFDILIIAMGMELAKINGAGRTYILTCDKRIETICKNLNKIFQSKDARIKHDIPDHIYIPNIIYLPKTSIKNFPIVNGQKRQ